MRPARWAWQYQLQPRRGFNQVCPVKSTCVRRTARKKVEPGELIATRGSRVFQHVRHMRGAVHECQDWNNVGVCRLGMSCRHRRCRRERHLKSQAACCCRRPERASSHDNRTQRESRLARRTVAAIEQQLSCLSAGLRALHRPGVSFGDRLYSPERGLSLEAPFPSLGRGLFLPRHREFTSTGPAGHFHSSRKTWPNRPARSWMYWLATRPERPPRVIAHSSASRCSSASSILRPWWAA